jgi:AcrR family transcriptional regulator
LRHYPSQESTLGIQASSAETVPVVHSKRRMSTRLRIVKGAAAAFAEKGAAATTVEDILQAASVSRRTFYQFFRDKQDALAAIFERSTEHLIRLQTEAVTDARDGLASILNGQDTYMNFVATAGPVVRVLATESLRPDSPLAPRRRWLHQRIATLYGDAYEKAEGKALDPLVLMSAILLVETVSIHVMTELNGEPKAVAHAMKVLRRLVSQMIESNGA